MSFVDGIEYGKDQHFDVNQLQKLAPLDVYCYLCLRAYDKPEPGLEDLPKVVRSMTLEYDKAILYFMPNGNDWDEHTNSGNPTKSNLVRSIFHVTQKKEVRKQGWELQATQEIDNSEFEQLLMKFQEFPDLKQCFAFPVMAKFQYNMMVHLDDTFILKFDDLKNNPQYPFALQCQLSWSKNVYEERSALYQILLGSDNHRYCILLGLAL